MAAASTREKLLSLVDDVDLISKEILENLLGPRNQKLSSGDYVNLVELLLQKEQELKDSLKQASEQEEIQQKMDLLQAEVDKHDQEIRTLQKHLKETEHILATAIYQAKQKLQVIAKANKQPISSEDLIKYAHRISASNAVAAPMTWQQGDPRRPYPTDMEMRMGILSRLGDPPHGSMMHQQPTSLSEVLGRGTSHPGRNFADAPTSSQTGGGNFTWHPSSELAPPLGSAAGNSTVHIVKGSNKENEDVEVMSTDSSSSSSSDSQ